jgi:hypothetical protein
MGLRGKVAGDVYHAHMPAKLAKINTVIAVDVQIIKQRIDLCGVSGGIGIDSDNFDHNGLTQMQTKAKTLKL